MTIDRIIEDTRRDIIKILREEHFVETVGKIGFIGTMGSLAIIAAVAVCAILVRFLQIEHLVFSAVLDYGPGIAAAFGTVSSIVTYYGWFRIVRGKEKLKVKQEGKSEAQNQLGEFIQSLPDMLGSFAGGCFSQASTAVLGVSLAASAVTYVPAVNEVFNKAVNAAERAVINVINQNTEEPAEKRTIEEEQTIETKETEAGTEAEAGTEEVVEEAVKQRIAGKLGLQGGRGEKERAVVELMSGNEVVAWVFADSEGNYAFYVVPGEYTVRVRLDGYEIIYSTPFELGSKDMQISEITINPMTDYAESVEYAEEKIKGTKTIIPAEIKPTGARAAGAKVVGVKPIETKPVETKAMKVPVQPTPLIQPKAPPKEMPLPPEPPPTPLKLQQQQQLQQQQLQQQQLQQQQLQQQQQQQQPDPPKAEAPKSGFFVGAGSELNNNSTSKSSTAMGGNVVLGYDMNKNFALGLNAIYSHDMDVMSTLESMIMFRYYLPVTSSFLQAEAGGALSTTEGKNSTAPLGGLTAGMRLEMEDRWYLEPTLRGGYPFTWGAGFTLGKKFGR